MTVGMTEPEVSTSNHVISDIFKEKLVIDWDCDDVYSWLISCGFKHYANLIAYEHNVDGMVLLSLKEADLRNPPLALTRLGDIKKLCKAFAELRSSLVSQINHSKTSDTPPIVLSDEDTSSWLFYPPHVKENSFTLQNGGVVENIHERQITTTATNLQNDKQFKMITKEELIRRIESPDTQAKSLIKLLLAFIYCSVSLLITSFVMVVVHDRVPDMKSYPPLPDLILDNIPLIPWAFEACELIGVIMTTIMTTVLIFHKHRVVITRRMFSVVGTVFLLRCITMFVTSLSVPGSHLECSAKTFGSLKDQLYQAYHIWSHMGMSIQGVRTCGDYMFSGHTTVITLLNHFITEYTDESWYGLHTTSWVLNLFAMFFILAGHEHYSIDVFIAFYISSRMFLYYHAYAYNHSNITSTDSRMRLWYPLAWFFESGGLGRVPNEFGEPFSLTIPTWRSDKKDDEMIFVEEHKVQEAFEIWKKKN